MKLRPEESRPFYPRQMSETERGDGRIHQLLIDLKAELSRSNFDHQQLLDIQRELSSIAQAVQAAIKLNEEQNDRI